MFLSDNTSQVNKIMVHTSRICSFAILALMMSTWLGFFNFKGSLKAIILIVGAAVTVVPTILYKLKVSDTFLKYYIMIAVSVMIGLLGCNNGVGVYITYALVPIASCLYFDKKFMLHMSIISYATMTLGVYVNSAGKLEVRFLNWSHMLAFRSYMIGFTIEYAVVILFLYQMVKRAQDFLESQQEHLEVLREEKRRTDRVSKIYNETRSAQRRTSFDMISTASKNFLPEDYTRLAAGHQYIAQLQGILNYSDDVTLAYNKVYDSIADYFKLARILFIEPSPSEEVEMLSYQWVDSEAHRLYDFCTELTDEERLLITENYDEYGYIEYGKGYEYQENFIDSGLTRYMAKHIIGRQLWIPTVEGGSYLGAFCFDKRDARPYDPIDIFLLSEVVSIISLHVMRHRADDANRAKSTFLSAMSHEIRTPLNAIIGMTTVSLREEMSDNLRCNLEIIKSSSEGLLRIINDILDFSKIESGKVEFINTDYSVKELLDEFKVLVDSRNMGKLEINYVFDEKMPKRLYGDVGRIRQIMLNLSTNSIKYTDEGHITITVGTEIVNDEGCMLNFSIEDTGRGIREEEMGKLFKSFSQVDQQNNHHKEGTGLGLAISKQLVELMKGNIGVESEYGKGSCFHFSVPQKIVDVDEHEEIDNSNDDAEEIEEPLNEAEELKVPDWKVLIVDDNISNLIVAESLLEPYEMEIITATDGMAAIEITSENKFDLIFMDRFMPEMDGDEATKIIRADETNPNSETPIVALTADAVVGAREELLEAGMDDFLSKPINVAEIERIIRKFHGNS